MANLLEYFNSCNNLSCHKRIPFGRKYCSKPCFSSNVMTKLNKNPEFREQSRKRMIKLNSNPDFLEKLRNRMTKYELRKKEINNVPVKPNM